MTSDQRLIAEYRSDANLLMMAAAKNHAFVADLHGQGKHDWASAMERRAMFQEDQAVILRLRAAEIEARIETATALMETANAAAS